MNSIQHYNNESIRLLHFGFDTHIVRLCYYYGSCLEWRSTKHENMAYQDKVIFNILVAGYHMQPYPMCNIKLVKCRDYCVQIDMQWMNDLSGQ